MLCRFGLLCRGFTKFSSSILTYTAQFESSAFFTSGPRSFRTLHKGYVFCAVGIVAGSSVSGYVNMAPLELAGRPGNLTDEQKVKLKEMWTVAFKVFGVPLDEGSEGDATPVNDLPTTNIETSSDNKEKKSGGKLTSIFKKKKEKEASPSPAVPSTDISKLAIADGDDKYSQTKEFKEALATSTPQEIRDTFWRMVKADHPDALFLRFLRARKWDVDKAIVMLVATMRWRTDPDIEVFLTVIQ